MLRRCYLTTQYVSYIYCVRIIGLPCFFLQWTPCMLWVYLNRHRYKVPQVHCGLTDVLKIIQFSKRLRYLKYTAILIILENILQTFRKYSCIYKCIDHLYFYWQIIIFQRKCFFEHCVLTHAIQNLVSYFKPKYRSCATFCVLAVYAECMFLQQHQPKSHSPFASSFSVVFIFH